MGSKSYQRLHVYTYSSFFLENHCLGICVVWCCLVFLKCLHLVIYMTIVYMYIKYSVEYACNIRFSRQCSSTLRYVWLARLIYNHLHPYVANLISEGDKGHPLVRVWGSEGVKLVIYSCLHRLKTEIETYTLYIYMYTGNVFSSSQNPPYMQIS